MTDYTRWLACNVVHAVLDGIRTLADSDTVACSALRQKVRTGVLNQLDIALAGLAAEPTVQAFKVHARNAIDALLGHVCDRDGTVNAKVLKTQLEVIAGQCQGATMSWAQLTGTPAAGLVHTKQQQLKDNKNRAASRNK